MNFESTIKRDSPGFPGVSYVLRRATKAFKIQFDLHNADAASKLRDLYHAMALLEPVIKPLRDENKKRPCTCDHREFDHNEEWYECTIRGCDCRRLILPVELNRKLTDIQSQQSQIIENLSYLAMARAALLSVEGITIDGNPLTAANLLDAPDGLVKEIGEFVASQLYLGVDERKNSERPTTSGEVEGGPIPTLIATAAEETDSTSTSAAETANASQT